MQEAIRDITYKLAPSVWDITIELAPWLLLGTAIAALLHGLLPSDFVERHLHGRGSVAKAVILGVPLPLCSCGVIPATGSSTNKSSGFCINNIPISSHCFCPCANAPASRWI